MKLSITAVFTLAITTASFADIYQYSDCDGNGTLLLTELNAEPFVDLSGLYLGCADLTGAYLTVANLTGAYLTYADLNYAELTYANLTYANLTDAELTVANLHGADLTVANLYGADLHGAYNWQSSTWTGATYNDATVFPDGMNPEKYGMIYDDTPVKIDGACCVTSGCAVMAEAMCTDLGGTWTEAGSCDDCAPTCAGDINADGKMDVEDLLIMIAAWGVCP